MKEIQSPGGRETESAELREQSERLGLPRQVSRSELRAADEALEGRLDARRNVGPGERLCARDWKKIPETRDLTRDLREVNPNYGEGLQWQTNCQRCVPTYEMRRRGYDVTALPRKTGEELRDSSLPVAPFSVWKNPEVIRCQGDGVRDIEERMKGWGDGARAEVLVVWDKTDSGHVFVAEQVNGETRFYDPQNGTADASGYFQMVKPDSVQLCRVDNLDVTDRIRECCKGR